MAYTHALIIVFLAILFCGCSTSAPPTTSERIVDNRPIIPLNEWGTIVEEVANEQNIIKLQDKFLGRNCIVKGTLLSIEPKGNENGGGGYWVYLQSDLYMTYIMKIPVYWVCNFEEVDRGNLGKLSNGQTVTAKGVFHSWEKREGDLFARLVIRDCSLIN